MLIRRMTSFDTDKVAIIEKNIFSMPWSKEGFDAAINQENNILLVAEIENDIVGYVVMYTSLDEGEITNVAVKTDCRKKHIGDSLIKELKEISNNKGVKRIVLEVRVSNKAAISLYEKNKFKKLGTRKNFYEKPREDAFIMECILEEK